MNGVARYVCAPRRTKDVDIDDVKMLNYYNYSICIYFRLTLVGCLDLYCRGTIARLGHMH